MGKNSLMNYELFIKDLQFKQDKLSLIAALDCRIKNENYSSYEFNFDKESCGNDYWIAMHPFYPALNPDFAYSCNFILEGFGYTNSGIITGGAYSQDLRQFDETLINWSSKTGSSFLHAAGAGFSLNGFGYVVAGYTVLGVSGQDNERYDSVLDAWTTKIIYPNLVRGCSAIISNENAFVGCGYDDGTATYFATLYKYNDILNSWLAMTSLRNRRAYAGSFNANNFGYICCGYGWYDYGGGGFAYLNDYNKYNGILNNWLYSFFGNTGSEITGFGFDGNGYTVWGNRSGSPVNDVFQYDDIYYNCGLKAAYGIARTGLSSFTLEYPYIFGGYSGSTYFTEIYKYKKYSLYNISKSLLKSFKKPKKVMVAMNNKTSFIKYNMFARLSGDSGNSWVRFRLSDKIDQIDLNSLLPNAGMFYDYKIQLEMDNCIAGDFWLLKRPSLAGRIAEDDGDNLNGYLYLFGSKGGAPYMSEDNEKYHSGLDSWSAVALFGVANRAQSVLSLNGFLYLVGGFYVILFDVYPIHTTSKYNDELNNYLNLGVMGFDTQVNPCLMINGFGYVFGVSGAPYFTCHKYNDILNFWSEIVRYPTDDFYACSFIKYLNNYANIIQYDDFLNSWTIKLLYSHNQGGGFDLNGLGYMATGGGAPYYNWLSEYNDSLNVAIRKKDIDFSSSSISVASVGKDGFGYVYGAMSYLTAYNITAMGVYKQEVKTNQKIDISLFVDY